MGAGGFIGLSDRMNGALAIHCPVFSCAFAVKMCKWVPGLKAIFIENSRGELREKIRNWKNEFEVGE